MNGLLCSLGGDVKWINNKNKLVLFPWEKLYMFPFVACILKYSFLSLKVA